MRLTIYVKGTPWSIWSRGSLGYYFLPFWVRGTNYEKGHDGVFFFISFLNSLNMKKILSYPSTGLVKNVYDERLVTMTRPSFSFIGLVKLARMDSFED